eukprot:TRINITY_DN25742_c0_g8_i1.p1 TRINITY_DN25742_c0_g8~~TRINITY_DN25742_c0_g8_i1.p1  ORF type:complete len:1422 (+),score=129.01 TRINITY_DN25742_c0_g8_i1:47-4267(+)
MVPTPSSTCAAVNDFCLRWELEEGAATELRCLPDDLAQRVIQQIYKPGVVRKKDGRALEALVLQLCRKARHVGPSEKLAEAVHVFCSAEVEPRHGDEIATRVKNLLLWQDDEVVYHMLNGWSGNRRCPDVLKSSQMPFKTYFRLLKDFHPIRVSDFVERHRLKQVDVEQGLLSINKRDALRLMSDFERHVSTRQNSECVRELMNKVGDCELAIISSDRRRGDDTSVASRRPLRAVQPNEVLDRISEGEEDEDDEDAEASSDRAVRSSAALATPQVESRPRWDVRRRDAEETEGDLFDDLDDASDVASVSNVSTSTVLSRRPSHGSVSGGVSVNQRLASSSGASSSTNTSISQSSVGFGSSASRILGAARPTRRLEPQHFVLVCDISGSMSERDVPSSENGTNKTTRIEAMQLECSNFVRNTALNPEDMFSLVHFSEAYCVIRAAEKSDRLAGLLGSADYLKSVAPKGRTFYSQGFKGAQEAICAADKAYEQRRATEHAPTLRKTLCHNIIFLSDGEPSDAKELHQVLQALVKRLGLRLCLFTIAFGLGADASDEEPFRLLAHMATVGHGRFQRAGRTLKSLRGAFSAITSTVSSLRDEMQEKPASAKSSLTLSQEPVLETEPRWQASGRSFAEALGPAVQRKAGKVGKAAGNVRSKIEACGPERKVIQIPASLSTRSLKDCEMESPQCLAEVYNTRQDGAWCTVQAERIMYSFNGWDFDRKSEGTRTIKFKHAAFMAGGMRRCHAMIDNVVTGDDRAMVRKVWRREGAADEQSEASAAVFARSTALSKRFARKFAKWTGCRMKFLDVGVYKVCESCDTEVIKPGSERFFTGEELIDGIFTKLNSNSGFVNQEEYGLHSEYAQAFTHWTFHHSRGNIMVSDVQGVCSTGASADAPYFVLSDPQVHSREDSRDELGGDFGSGDLGCDGMYEFFHTHSCGPTCRKLGLSVRESIKLMQAAEITHIPHVTPLVESLQPHGKYNSQVRDIEMRTGCLVRFPKRCAADVMARPFRPGLPVYVFGSNFRGQARRTVTELRRLFKDTLPKFCTRLAIPPQARAARDATSWIRLINHVQTSEEVQLVSELEGASSSSGGDSPVAIWVSAECKCDTSRKVCETASRLLQNYIRGNLPWPTQQEHLNEIAADELLGHGEQRSSIVQGPASDQSNIVSHELVASDISTPVQLQPVRSDASQSRESRIAATSKVQTDVQETIRFGSTSFPDDVASSSEPALVCQREDRRAGVDVTGESKENEVVAKTSRARNTPKELDTRKMATKVEVRKDEDVAKKREANESRARQRQIGKGQGAATSLAVELPVGCWVDERGDRYEVFLDRKQTTCSVRTTRRDGRTRITEALIRLDASKDSSRRRVLWSGRYELEASRARPDQIRWKDSRGGKDFMWTRTAAGAER